MSRKVFKTFLDKLGNTPLHRVKETGMAERLLKHGVDVNTRNSAGKTPLANAAKYNEDIVPILLRYGADVKIADTYGVTPLHRATTEKAARLLLEHGADPNSRVLGGGTPLHFAAQNRIGEVVSVLLEYGADINVEDKKGFTVLDAVSRYNNIESRKNDSEGFALTLDKGFDEIELTDENFRSIDRIIKSHIIKLKAASLFLSEKNLEAISYSMGESEDKIKRRYNPPNYQHSLFKYELECREELKVLKGHKLNEMLTVYDVLRTKKPFYALDEVVVASLKSIDYSQYPNYEFLIKNKYKSDSDKVNKGFSHLLRKQIRRANR